jgi:hypothetical protein
VPIILSHICSGRLRRADENSDACCCEYGVERIGELACAIPDQEPDGSCALAEVHQEVPRCLRGPRAVGVHGDAGQADLAGVVLDDDKRVYAPQENGVHVHEIGREDAAGLGGQEVLPGRAAAAGRRIDPGVVQDLPDRGGGDLVAEPDELASHAPVPHVGLSVAMRMTSFRIAAAVGGCPGRRRP